LQPRGGGQGQAILCELTLILKVAVVGGGKTIGKKPPDLVFDGVASEKKGNPPKRDRASRLAQ